MTDRPSPILPGASWKSRLTGGVGVQVVGIGERVVTYKITFLPDFPTLIGRAVTIKISDFRRRFIPA